MKNRTSEIPIGDSAAEFLRLMGQGDDGKRYRTLRKQMHALAACRLQLGYPGRTYSGQPIQQFDAWVTNRDHPTHALWPGKLILSEEYYRSLIAAPVPLDNRALLVLKGSALALDVYVWLAHRLHRIHGKPQPVHWVPLREQFGQEYANPKNFKSELLHVLKLVLAAYPQAKVRHIDGGLLLHPSPPPVPIQRHSLTFRPFIFSQGTVKGDGFPRAIATP